MTAIIKIIKKKLSEDERTRSHRCLYVYAIDARTSRPPVDRDGGSPIFNAVSIACCNQKKRREGRKREKVTKNRKKNIYRGKIKVLFSHKGRRKKKKNDSIRQNRRTKENM